MTSTYFFYAVGITYWIDFGTLLGAVRDGHVIPWDNDCDISYDSEQSDRVHQAVSEIHPPADCNWFKRESLSDPNTYYCGAFFDRGLEDWIANYLTVSVGCLLACECIS